MTAADPRVSFPWFVIPYAPRTDAGPDAGWLSTAGWAGAARRAWDGAVLLTPSGPMEVEEARSLATQPRQEVPAIRSRWARHVPRPVITAARDIQRWRRARTLALAVPDAPSPAFIWQRHELFHTAGLDLAQALQRPSVLFVAAPQVWEAQRWGVRRPGWSHLAEMLGDVRPMQHADLVVCTSDEVQRAVNGLGISPARTVVTTSGADPELFRPTERGAARTRERLALGSSFVVGWVGSFRPFHGLDLALDACALASRRVPDLALLLVGDGQERQRIEARSAELGLRVTFTGTVSPPEVAELMTAMDVALVLDPGHQHFHYSPLKLSEYLHSGRAVIAPSSGEIPNRLHHERDALLVQPGSSHALAHAIERLASEPQLRWQLGKAAQEQAEADASWERQLDAIWQRLQERPDNAGSTRYVAKFGQSSGSTP